MGKLRLLKNYRCSPSDWMFMAQRLTLPGDCLLWKGAVDKDGYGQIQAGNVPKLLRVTRAHQLSYAMAYGDIPKGAVVRHTCDTPTCINPAHLEVGTVAENNADSYIPGRTCRIFKLTLAKYTEIMALKGTMSSRKAADVVGLNFTTVLKCWKGVYATRFM